jgi:hypothetical protein
MKNKIGYILSSILVVVMMTGCTKYASASPTPETPQLPQIPQGPTISIPTPTLAALEVEVATRTPIPLVLKTATPTESLSDILTATLPGGEEIQIGTPQKTGIGGTPGTSLTRTTQTVGTLTAPTNQAFPTRAPFIIVAGKPTISIVHVKYADSITVSITNLDPNTELKIRMGSPASFGADGPVVGTVKADETGAIDGTYKIPEAFMGFGQIEFRIEFPDGTPYYFFFTNLDY